MAEIKLLPVRLRPLPNEHFSAYLLRLAVANGRSSVRELLATIGIKGVKAAAQHHHHPEILDSLAGYLGRSSSELSASLARTGVLRHIAARDDSRVYRHLDLPYPRICLVCLQSSSMIPAYAGLLPFTHCLEHGRELLHACPQCHSPFKWSEELFEFQCADCGARIEQDGSASALPSYAHEVIARQADTISLNCYIRDLLLALQRVFSPISSDLTAHERPPTAPMHWPSLLSQAHALLDEAEAISRWVATCTQQRSFAAGIGKSAVYLPIDTLREKLTLRWRLHEVDCYADSRPSPPIPVSPGSCNERLAVGPEPAKGVDHQQLSKTLGCKPSEVLALLDAGAITCSKGHRSVRDARFDVANLADQVGRLTTHDADDFIIIEQATRIASVHGGHAGHVLAGILRNEIPFRPMPGRRHLLEGAQVGRKGLMAYMSKHFASLESTQCTLPATIAITGLTEREITEACRRGLIKPLASNGAFHFLGRDIGYLLITHVSVRRWSKISGIAIRQLQQGLASQRFTAAIEGVLYQRTAALDSWLNSFSKS